MAQYSAAWPRLNYSHFINVAQSDFISLISQVHIFGLIRSRIGCYALSLSNSSSSKCLPLKAGTKPSFKENRQGSIKLSVFTTQNKSSSRSTTYVLAFYIFRPNYIQNYLEVPKLNFFNNAVQWLKTII